MQEKKKIIVDLDVHLKNKKEVINEVLKKNGLKTISIIGPEEI